MRLGKSFFWYCECVGCSYDEVDTKLFSIIAILLLQRQALTSHEVVSGTQQHIASDASIQDGRDKLSQESRIMEALARFQDDLWLKRTDRNLWEIAPRAYLELSTYFQVSLHLKYFAH